ncbi:prepilin-type N-terminal cleavage/methylation domain-containing protein [Chromobacterium sp. IIBBL 290-4]|uniref:type IV pilus modification PilV family protein n=1 Tax=Chromobacterium sp. IIBBL 290-4 TaxID=2953890 RepID=UPI0020B675C7|nr:prepilin-type N-terminal cleavage/methylation domain-containing protein [Chromobacterium sp. IIBBL 290-4]UTH76508.1 prepilin-type N-terminal cleavage/methylation domain-containing protein [Chromobacterium sp. IIBBL 290-4]
MTAGRMRGFTLLEMMISLLVLAIGALGLLRLQTELLHSQISANDYNTATNLAQAALEQRYSDSGGECRQADFAPARASGTLARYQCRSLQKKDQIVVEVQWVDSQGETNTLSLAAPSKLSGG